LHLLRTEKGFHLVRPVAQTETDPGMALFVLRPVPPRFDRPRETSADDFRKVFGSLLGQRQQAVRGPQAVAVGHVLHGSPPDVSARVLRSRTSPCIVPGPGRPAQASAVTRPVPPSTRSRWPVRSRRGTSGRPATAGRPNSRATMAPCDSTPPVSITRPFAPTNSGTQAGAVEGQTRT